MTDELKALKNLVKQFNERIAKIGRQYGNDSLIYKKVVDSVTNILPPTLKMFAKITSSGFFAIDQKVSTLEAIQGVQTETALENAIHGFRSSDSRKQDIEGIPTLGEYNAKIRQGLQREEAFSDFDKEFEQTTEFQKAKTEAQMKQYSNVKEAVQKFLKDNPTAVSPIVNDMTERIMERRPTYWEWYRAIDRYINGNDSESWKNIQETTAQMMEPTKPHVPQAMQQMAEQEAENIRRQAGVAGSDPYATERPTNPRRR